MHDWFNDDDGEHHIKYLASEGGIGRTEHMMQSLPSPLTNDYPDFVSTNWCLEFVGQKSAGGIYDQDIMACGVSALPGVPGFWPWKVTIHRPIKMFRRIGSKRTPWSARGRQFRSVAKTFKCYVHKMLWSGMIDGKYSIKVIAGSCESWADAVEQVRECLDIRSIVKQMGREFFDPAKWLPMRPTGLSSDYREPASERSPLCPFSDFRGIDVICHVRVDEAHRACQQLNYSNDWKLYWLVGPDENGKCVMHDGQRTGTEIQFDDWVHKVILHVQEPEEDITW